MSSAPRIDNIESNDNVILNSNFDYWQEGGNFVAIADATYFADLFRYGKNGTMVHTLTQSTNVPNVRAAFSVLTTVTTAQVSLGASNFNSLRYVVEGYDILPMAGETITLSFMARATKTGIYSVGIRNATATRSIALEYTITASNTWTPVTLTFTHDATGAWDYTTGVGFEIFFVQGVGSSLAITPGTWQNSGALGSVNQVNNCDTIGNIFGISQIMMKRGSTSGFYRRAGKTAAQELSFIQRYYETGLAFNGGYVDSSTLIAGGYTYYKVTKRATPSGSNIVLSNINWSQAGTFDPTLTANTLLNTTISGFGLRTNNPNTRATGSAGLMSYNWAASARL